MKNMLIISIILASNANAEAIFTINKKTQNKFEVIDSKNQWLSAEEKCNVIESYNTIGTWSPLVSNQSTDFNQERITQNFDRISCIMQEYNERLNQYRDIGEATIKVEEKESDIESRLIGVTDTGLVEIGEVFNCGAYNPLLTSILTVGTFNVSQSCQQNQEGKYLYSTGENFTYNTSVKNKNIDKSVVATKENETITNLSCTNWTTTSWLSSSSVQQKRICNQEIKNDIVIRYNQIIVQTNIIKETKQNTENRVENIECSYQGVTYFSVITSSKWPYYEEYCGMNFNNQEIKTAYGNNNSCGEAIKNDYYYFSNNYINTEYYYNEYADSNETIESYQTCRYKIN